MTYRRLSMTLLLFGLFVSVTAIESSGQTQGVRATGKIGPVEVRMQVDGTSDYVESITNEMTANYRSDLVRRIKRAWFPPIGSGKSGLASVSFKISRDGEMSDLKLLRKSKSPTFDQAALKAVENAAPFRPLPATGGTVADVVATFPEYVAHVVPNKRSK